MEFGSNFYTFSPTWIKLGTEHVHKTLSADCEFGEKRHLEA